MKTPRFFSKLLLLAVCGLAATAPSLRALDFKHFDAQIPLQPTLGAPTGATAKAYLQANEWEGFTKATLKVQARAFIPGTYTITALLKSDTTAIALGTLTITGSVPAASGTELVPASGIAIPTTQSIVFGSSTLPLPEGFAPFGLEAISVLDANSLEIFHGDLSGGVYHLNGIRSIVPGPSAPEGTGKFMVNALGKNGVEKSVITLFVRKVPSSLAYTVNVNGVPTSQAIATKNGQIRLGQLPGKHRGFSWFGQNLVAFDLDTVSLTDSNGEIILTVDP